MKGSTGPNELPLGWLPNQDGFKFIGIMKDGSERDCTVVKGPDGLHTTDAPYRDLRGWKRK